MTISLVEVYTKGREICHFGLSKVPKGLTGAFYGREKVEKTFWFCDLFIFKRQPHLTPVNRDVKFQSKYVKGVPFVNRRYTKGEPFQSKMFFFRRVGPLGGAFAFKTSLSTSPRKYAFPLTSFCLVPEVFIFL